MTEDSVNLKRRIEELEEVHRLAESLSLIAGVFETLETIGDCCMKLCKAERASIVLFKIQPDETVQTLVRRTTRTDPEIDHSLNNFAAGWVEVHQKPLMTDDIIETLAIKNPQENARQLAAFLAIPLTIDGKIIGTMNLANRRGGRRFSDEELRMAAIVAPLAARFIQRAEMHDSLTQDNVRLKNALKTQESVDFLIGNSVSMKHVHELIARVAPSTANVLIIGESGTGKELVAHAIHVQSSRIEKPFVAVNCSAIPESLFESELFGHEKGSFTGATDQRKGKFEIAHEGTLFLDEISAMPLNLQPKLLRVLEQRVISRVGSAVEMKVDVRLIAATNKDLREAAKRGEFREDLFHRLNVLPVHLPPLRDRSDDIPLLAETFLREFSQGSKHFSADALEMLMHYEWRGNVRELRNTVERISILASAHSITPEDLRALHLEAGKDSPPELIAGLDRLLRTNGSNQDILELLERNLVTLAMQHTDGNTSKASRILGIHRNALLRRLEKYNIPASVESPQ